MRKQEGKIELQNLEIHRRICVKDITFLASRPMSFLLFFHLLLPFCLLRFYIEKKTFASEIGVWVRVCVCVCVCVGGGGDAGAPPPPPVPPDVGLI